jgi:hypothetical protein
MKAKQVMGTNRTGAALSPDLIQEMIAAAMEFPPSSQGDAMGIAEMRASYSKGEPIGTMPPPANVKGVAKTVMNAVTGGAPLQLLDKLGERLAFERTGTRVWEAMVAKYDAVGSFTGGPSRDELVHIRDEELRHFTMLRDLVERLDADPTAVTPSADVAAVLSMGIPKVLTDPRTTMAQALEGALLAELADNDCWPPLLELLVNGGYDEEAQRFLCAVKSEREHLQHVRTWLANAQGRSVEDVENLTAAEAEAVLSSSALGSLGDGAEAMAASEMEDDEAEDVEDDEDEEGGEATTATRKRTPQGRAAGRSTGGGTGAKRGRAAGGKRASGAKAPGKTAAQKRRRSR